MNSDLMDFTPDLAALDEDYASVHAEERSAVPDGFYQVNVESVELKRSRTTQKPMIGWKLRIISSNQRNRVLFKNSVLEGGEKIKFVKGDLACCGLVLEKLSDLPGNLERLLDVKLEVSVRNKDGNSNVYFNKRIEVSEKHNRQLAVDESLGVF
jgi:hypothetical protein